MTAMTEAVYNHALKLSEAEREELIDALQALDEPPVDENELRGEAWLAEINRRSDAIDRGEVVCIPWKEVHARMQAKYGKASDE